MLTIQITNVRFTPWGYRPRMYDSVELKTAYGVTRTDRSWRSAYLVSLEFFFFFCSCSESERTEETSHIHTAPRLRAGDTVTMAAATTGAAISRSFFTLARRPYRLRHTASERASACIASLFNTAYPSVPRFATLSLQQRCQFCTSLPRRVESVASYPLPLAPPSSTPEFAFALESVNPFCAQHCLETTQSQLFHH